MTRGFERPVGAAADLSELEYISALHQTQSGPIRTDGSIRDVDIMHFLRSRYGLEVDIETVRRTVLFGLGGDFEGDDDGEDKYADENAGNAAADPEDHTDGIDLAEMVAVLLIPTLIKSARKDHSGIFDGLNGTTEKRERSRSAFSPNQANLVYPDRGLIRDVLAMILQDVTGSLTPKELNPSLIRSILIAFSEEDLAHNESLVEDMVCAAAGGVGDVGGGGSGAPLLDADAFARGLTSDVLLLDVENEVRISSNYHDVLKAGSKLSSAVDDNVSLDRKDIGSEEAPRIRRGQKVDLSSKEKLKLTFSAAAIDYIADQYQSKMLVVFLWTGFVLVYFTFNDRIDVLIGENHIKAQAEKKLAECGSFLQPESTFPDNLVADSFLEAFKAKICYLRWWDEGIANPTGIMQTWKCDPDSSDWGCSIGRSVVGWLYVLGLLSVLGLAYVGLGSIGNNVRARRRQWALIFGIASVAMLSYGAFFSSKQRQSTAEGHDGMSFNITYSLVMNVTGDVPVELNAPEPTAAGEIIEDMTLAISTVAIILQLQLLLSPVLRWGFASLRCHSSMGSALSQRIFTPGSIQAEAKIKQAAAHKINEMVKNARKVYNSSEADDANASFGQGLVNFSLQENKVELAGDFLWMWRRIFSGELYTKEGIWISSRLIAGNFAQILMSIFIIFFGITITERAVEQWRMGLEDDDILFTALGWIGINVDRTNIYATASGTVADSMEKLEMNCRDTITDLQHDYAASTNIFLRTSPEDALQVCTLLEHAIRRGVSVALGLVEDYTLSSINTVNSVINEMSDSIYPKEEVMIRAPLILATVVAFLSVVILSLVYIPSVIATTLKLRSGVIPFMHDKKNQYHYRSEMDLVTLVLGSMFWGALYSAAFIGAFSGGILFLFLWQVTQPYMVWISMQLIGLAITISLKSIITYVFLRATVYVAFYRKKPAQGNIVSLILEVANIAYAIWTAMVRAVTLIIISTIYIGRLDTPLLADGVGVSELGLSDKYPIIFRKEILAHEAHRHPYLERLGSIYMMKIRYGEEFGNEVGYCYRLIFAVALMPWIRKYRVMARPNVGLLGEEDINLGNSILMPKRASILNSSLGTGTPGLSNKMARPTVLESGSEVEELREKNQDLQIENEDLRTEIQSLRKALADANVSGLAPSRSHELT